MRPKKKGEKFKKLFFGRFHLVHVPLTRSTFRSFWCKNRGEMEDLKKEKHGKNKEKLIFNFFFLIFEKIIPIREI